MSTEYLNNRVFENIIENFQQAKREKSRNELILEDRRETWRRKCDRKCVTTADKVMLEEAKIKFDDSQDQFVDAQELLAAAFYTLSENIVRYAKFNLIDADDAIQEGVMICFDKIDRFDSNKGKAFNYMTTCILNHFRQLYRTARNYNELKKRYHDFLSIRFSTKIIKNGKEISIFNN